MSARDRLKELLQRATPGPCKVVTLEFNEESGDIRYVVEFQGVKSGSVPEARRIEEAINAIPALLEIADAAWQALFVESKQMQDWTEEDLALYAALSQVMLDDQEAPHED